MNTYYFTEEDHCCFSILPDDYTDKEIEEMRQQFDLKDEEDSIPTAAERNPNLR